MIEWKPVVGYEGDYEVSNTGAVMSLKHHHHHLMTPRNNKFTGYKYVVLFRDGVGKTIPIHRLVAMAFVPNPENHECVNHINENKWDNRASNLEWCTIQQNTRHSSHKWRKRVTAKTIDGEWVATFCSGEMAAKMLGVCKSSISQAINSKTRTCKGLVLSLEEV